MWPLMLGTTIWVALTTSSLKIVPIMASRSIAGSCLAHAHVVEQGLGDVDAEARGLRVEIAEVHRGIGRVLDCDVRRNVRLPGRDHGRAHRGFAAEHIEVTFATSGSSPP